VRPDHQWHEKIAEGRRDRRNQEKPNHDDAMRGEHAVVERGRNQALRCHQVDADDRGGGAADEKEKRDRDEIEDRDALVISRQQP
jgi:hypothetical protein